MGKLYIFEGLPCSGKSTTARYAAESLRKKGKQVICIDEGTGNHPADYEFHAYVALDAFEGMDEGLRERIRQVSEKKAKGYVAPLSAFSGSDFDVLLQYKLYDFLPWETEMPVMLDAWQDFADKAKEEDAVYVFNCVFLQNPMCETMMRFGFDYEQSASYVRKIADILKPLKPVVFYLSSKDIAGRIEKTSSQREGWLESVIDYHVNGRYGRSIHAEGFEGYIACLRERQRREIKMLDELPVESVVMEAPDRSWEDAYKTIDMVLNTDCGEKADE